MDSPRIVNIIQEAAAKFRLSGGNPRDLEQFEVSLSPLINPVSVIITAKYDWRPPALEEAGKPPFVDKLLLETFLRVLSAALKEQQLEEPVHVYLIDDDPIFLRLWGNVATMLLKEDPALVSAFKNVRAALPSLFDLAANGNKLVVFTDQDFGEHTYEATKPGEKIDPNRTLMCGTYLVCVINWAYARAEHLSQQKLSAEVIQTILAGEYEDFLRKLIAQISTAPAED